MRSAAEFSGVGVLDAAQVPGSFNHGHLHSKANSEIRHLALTRELHRSDLAFTATLAEPARNQNAVYMLEKRGGVFALEDLGLDPVEIDPHLVGDSAMGECLNERLIGILEPGIFADDRNGNIALGIADALVD